MGRWKQEVEAKGREGREDRTAQCPSSSVICPLVQTCRSVSACNPDPHMPQAEWKADGGPSKGVTRKGGQPATVLGNGGPGQTCWE